MATTRLQIEKTLKEIQGAISDRNAGSFIAWLNFFWEEVSSIEDDIHKEMAHDLFKKELSELTYQDRIKLDTLGGSYVSNYAALLLKNGNGIDSKHSEASVFVAKLNELSSQYEKLLSEFIAIIAKPINLPLEQDLLNKVKGLLVLCNQVPTAQNRYQQIKAKFFQLVAEKYGKYSNRIPPIVTTQARDAKTEAGAAPAAQRVVSAESGETTQLDKMAADILNLKAQVAQLNQLVEQLRNQNAGPAAAETPQKGSSPMLFS